MPTKVNDRITNRFLSIGQEVERLRGDFFDPAPNEFDPSIPELVGELLDDCIAVRHLMCTATTRLWEALDSGKILDYPSVAQIVRGPLAGTAELFEQTGRLAAWCEQRGYPIEGAEVLQDAASEARAIERWMSQWPSFDDAPTIARVEQARRGPSRSIREFAREQQEIS